MPTKTLLAAMARPAALLLCAPAEGGSAAALVIAEPSSAALQRPNGAALSSASSSRDARIPPRCRPRFAPSGQVGKLLPHTPVLARCRGRRAKTKSDVSSVRPEATCFVVCAPSGGEQRDVFCATCVREPRCGYEPGEAPAPNQPDSITGLPFPEVQLYTEDFPTGGWVVVQKSSGSSASWFSLATAAAP